jgi:hypothetical protein
MITSTRPVECPMVTGLRYLKSFKKKKINVQFSLINVENGHLQYGCILTHLSMECKPHAEHLSCVLRHKKINNLVPFFCLLCIYTPYFSCIPTHGSLTGEGSLTMVVVNSAYHHSQTTSQKTTNLQYCFFLFY